MVGDGVFSVTTLGYGALIIFSTLVGAGVSTLGGAASLAVCYNHGVATYFSGGIETGLPFVLGLPTVFNQCVKMVPQYLDVVVPLLSLQHPVRLY